MAPTLGNVLDADLAEPANERRVACSRHDETSTSSSRVHSLTMTEFADVHTTSTSNGCASHLIWYAFRARRYCTVTRNFAQAVRAAARTKKGGLQQQRRSGRPAGRPPSPPRIADAPVLAKCWHVRCFPPLDGAERERQRGCYSWELRNTGKCGAHTGGSEHNHPCGARAVNDQGPNRTSRGQLSPERRWSGMSISCSDGGTLNETKNSDGSTTYDCRH